MSLFCQRHRCPPAEFEERAFRILLYRRARLLAPLIRKTLPRCFERDFMLVRYLGKARRQRDALHELAALVEANQARGGVARKILRIRISTRKAGALVGQLFDGR